MFDWEFVTVERGREIDSELFNCRATFRQDLVAQRAAWRHGNKIGQDAFRVLVDAGG